MKPSLLVFYPGVIDPNQARPVTLPNLQPDPATGVVNRAATQLELDLIQAN